MSDGAPSSEQREEQPRHGIASKLLAATVIVFFGAAVAMSILATTQLDRGLSSAHESKGQIIATAVSGAVEREVELAQHRRTVDETARLDEVLYVVLEDERGRVVASSFPEDALPPGLSSPPIQLKEGKRPGVRVAHYAYSSAPRTPLVRVVEVSVPVGQDGEHGRVRVGMDRSAILQQVSRLRWAMVTLGMAVAVSASAVLLVITLLSIVRPVRELTRVTGEIVRTGDLTQEIRIQSMDEIGQLANAFRAMVTKLREIPLVIRDSTGLLVMNVEQLSSSTSEQTETITRQASALQVTQATAQEIRQTSSLAAKRAEDVLQYAERGESVSRTGESAVEQSLAALIDIRGQVQEITQRIGRLGERTLQIGRVAQAVKDLADQTNMLALNAAIEAVRAGEHQKGFAVVAREMRSLADQSIQGTKQVREMLDDIAAAIREAVSITERGVQRIDAGLEQMKTSGQTLGELSRIVRENSLAVRQIIVAVEQQNSGISAISSAINDQSRLMDDTIRRLSVTSQSVDSLASVSQRLVHVVSQFRS